MNKSIGNFFYAESICIVGASAKEKSIGFELLNSIKNYGYRGTVFPVNPKAESILGYKCYKSVADINQEIDLAIIVVPKKFVMQAVEDIINKKVQSIILITAGFKEIGAEGEILEKKILSLLGGNEVRMIGPNCMGVINTIDSVKLNATFVAEEPQKGTTAFLSQSGALGAAVLNSLRETDIKFAHFISVGNKADLNENDLIEFWESDNNINIITLYLESFENGLGLLKKIMSGEISKPILVLKAGKTKTGMKAASSHTGALSSEDKVVDALLNQFGIIRAGNLNDMFNTAKGFENFAIPSGNRIAVVTNAGGPAILAVDKIEETGLVIAELSESTKEKLKLIVHPEGSINNPVDLLPGGDAETYRNVSEILLGDPGVDSVISIFVEPVMVDPMEVAEAVNSINSEKPLLQVIMPRPEFWSCYRQQSQYSKPLFRNPEEPPAIISNMLRHKKTKEKIALHSSVYLNLLNSNLSSEQFRSGYLDQPDLSKIAEIYNIPVVKEFVVGSEAISNLTGLTYPVVLKAVGEKLIHKSDLGAVKLNIGSYEELKIAAQSIRMNLEKRNISLENFIIQDFVKIKHELLIGGTRDSSFGPLIVFGSGGKYVEIFDDTSIRSAYSSRDDLIEMITETKIGKILAGIRGEEPADSNGLVDLLVSCCKMMIEIPDLTEFDLNPLAIDENNNYKVVDMRIRIKNDK
ncbi:MAG: acetate--CoA ligase family protein [Melioribacteraceae bacterium]|nr:acetate--CoA ligase family protein [Melioribacteraceae bacterium]